MTTIKAGQGIAYGFRFVDQNGVPLANQPTPDVPPTWTDNPMPPGIDTFTVINNNLNAVLMSTLSGLDLVKLSVTTGGVVFNASDLVTIGGFWLAYANWAGQGNLNVNAIYVAVTANFNGVGGMNINPLMIHPLPINWAGAGNMVTVIYEPHINTQWAGIGKLAINAIEITFATGIQLGGQAGPPFSINFPNATDAGVLVGAITVTTASGGPYIGTISIDNANFSLSPTSNVLSTAYPCSLYVGQSNISAGTYVIHVTALP